MNEVKPNSVMNPDLNPVGSANKPSEGNWGYFVPTARIMSKSEDGETYRFAVITYFVQRKDGRWIAKTVKHIFGDDHEDVRGKTAYWISFTNPEYRPGRTTDRSVFNERGVIGKVDRVANPLIVWILVDEAFTETDEFRNTGMWINID